MSKISKSDAEKAFSNVVTGNWVVWWSTADHQLSVTAAPESYETIDQAQEAAQDFMESEYDAGILRKNAGYLYFELVMDDED